MNEDTINELQALLDAGTQGEWTHYWRVNALGHADCGVTAHPRDGQGYSVCRAPRYQTQPKWENDASLIVALHNHAPALLQAARENRRLREALEDISSHLDIRGVDDRDNYMYLKEIASEALGKETV